MQASKDMDTFDVNRGFLFLGSSGISFCPQNNAHIDIFEPSLFLT